MPAIKETPVEVESNVIPEPVSKEIPKCVKSEEEKKVETTDSLKTEPVKAQDTVVTSSETKQDADEEKSAVGANGKEVIEEKKEAEEAKVEVEKCEDSVVSSENGKSLEPCKATPEVDGQKPDTTEDALDVETTGSENQLETSEAASKVEHEKKPAETEEAPVVASEKDDKTAADGGKVENVEAVVADGEKTEPVEKLDSSEAIAEVDGEKSSEDSSKGDEKMETDVTSSDQAKKPEVKMDDETAVGSTSEPAQSAAGSSSSAEPSPDVLKEIESLKKQGLAQYVQREFCAAADSFGKLLELQAPLYGEMSEKLGETYFLYGSAMYEFGKSENTVLGEKVKENDDVDEENEDDDEKMEEGEEGEKSEDKTSEEKPANVESEPSDDKPADETITGEEQEDEDDAFRVAWEMLELAKATFHKGDNKKRLADTLMKLGEVGIETGNAEAISEMLQGLEVRKKTFPENHRIVPETHFNIGVAFAFFEKYDEAVDHFNQAKSCLEKRIEMLSKSETKEDLAEIEEMKQILPDIEEKIKDTQESKVDKEKIKETAKEVEPKEAPFPAGDAKPVSNITHLVRRKRKVDDIADERAAKQSRQEDVQAAEGDKAEKTEGREEGKEEMKAEKTEGENEEKNEEKTDGATATKDDKTEEETTAKDEKEPEKMEE